MDQIDPEKDPDQDIRVTLPGRVVRALNGMARKKGLKRAALVRMKLIELVDQRERDKT